MQRRDVGDICGVISGSASATIAVRVWSMHPGMQELAITLSMSALAAGLTVGGKACAQVALPSARARPSCARRRPFCTFSTPFPKNSVRSVSGKQALRL
ncbi:MAG: hypothetical protein ACLR8U_14845 [Oscillospiraceae bacterium]